MLVKSLLNALIYSALAVLAWLVAAVIFYWAFSAAGGGAP